MRFLPSFTSLALAGVFAFSAPAAAATGNAVPPAPVAAPAQIAAEPGNGKVTLTWSPVPGAEGYRVYRGVKGVWIKTPVGRTTLTSHTSQGLENGTLYSFTVAAYSKGGNGPLSLAISAMPLAPPGDITATAGDRRVTLAWLPSAGATSYTIYRRVGNDSDFTELTTGVMTSTFVDPQLTNGTRHYYRVTAVTAAAQSEWSANVSAVPVPPPPASTPVLSAAAGNSKVTLTWTAVPDAPGYSIYRSTTGAFAGPPIATTSETTFKNTGLENDTTYFYTVAARNMGGDGPRAAVVTTVPVAPPLAPENLSAVPGKKQMTLTWSPTPGASAYNVYRSSIVNREAMQPVAAALAGTRFIDTNISNGLTYFYTVTAHNAGGESPRAPEIRAGRGLPAAPTVTADTLAAVDFCAVPAAGTFQRLLRKVKKPF
jgi:fibronectin type 3 domain-containing protein